MITRIGKNEIDKLIEESDNMETSLNQQPVTTVDYVKYLEYLDDANTKLNDMENNLDYCKELYDIMEEFTIPVPDEDMSNYLGVSVTMASLRNLVDKKLDELNKTIKSFNDQMNKDISALISEVGGIKDECMVCNKLIIYSFPPKKCNFSNLGYTILNQILAKLLNF